MMKTLPMPTAKIPMNKLSLLRMPLRKKRRGFNLNCSALPESLLTEYLASPSLADYRFHLEKMLRMKKHTLSPDNEKLMALAGQALQTSHKAFSAINDADFKFGHVDG